MLEKTRSGRSTQIRVVALFTDKARLDCLGYRYLGDWSKLKQIRSLKQAMMQDLLTGGVCLI